MRRNEDIEKKQLFSKRNNSVNIDRGWAWMVLLGCSVCSVISLGMPSNVGVLYVDIQRKLDVSLVDISLIGSLQTGLVFSSGVISCPMANRFGSRKIAIFGSIMVFVGFLLSSFITSLYAYYACLGILAGVGFSCNYSSALLILNLYFDQRRSFAILIFLAASGIGVLSFGPLTSFLLDHLGLEGTLLVLGSILLNSTGGAMLFFPLHHTKIEHERERSKLCGFWRVYLDKEMWSDPMLYLILSSAFVYGSGFGIAFTLLPDYIVSKGIPLSTASLSITMMGITSMISRFSAGFLSNNFPFLNRWIYIFAGFFAGGSLFFIPLCHSAAEFLVTAGAVGFFYGFVSGLLLVLTVELFGSQKVSVYFGIMMLVFGLGTFIGSPVAGVLAENVSLTGVEFVLSGVGFLTSGVLLLPSLFDRCRNRRTRCHTYSKENESVEERQPLLENSRNHDSSHVMKLTLSE